jgi:KipI family sensor histidine kinase inhibitor
MLAPMAEWVWSGERGLLRRFDGDLAEANDVARGLFTAIASRSLPEVEEVVPGARTILIVLKPNAEPGDELVSLLEAPPQGTSTEHREHVVAVRYDGEDLASVAAEHGLSTQEVIRLHSEPTYVVGFIGFSPGFPYLMGLPQRLHTPRLATPRTKVPAGSVGIAGAFTGIYPASTPGGWRLIGTASIDLFDARQEDPALMHPGDLVRFEPA